MTSAHPFDDIRALLLKMPKADEAAVAAAREREAVLTKPAGSLGRLEEISAFLAGWQASARPHVDHPLVAVFAGNHGVVAKGVSAYPPSVTRAMVANFTSGGAAINQICKTFDISLKVYRAGAGKADRRHHRDRRDGRADLRRNDRLRHGGAGLRAGPACPRRNGHRQHHARRRRSITPSTAARPRTGSDAAPASTTPG